MKSIILIISLTFHTAFAQNISVNRGMGGGFSDGAEMTVNAPAEITADQALQMYELVSNLYTNNTDTLDSSLRVTVTHTDKIAQKPDVCLAQFTPELIKDLYRLRSTYLDLMNRVAYESADRQIEGMPRGISTRYGQRRTNVFKKSDRDKENIEHRAALSAIQQLKRLIAARFKVRTYAMTNHITHHYKIPDGEYLLCVMQRVKDHDSKALMGSKWAVWWTKVNIQKDQHQELILDESNAITWREIFAINN